MNNKNILIIDDEIEQIEILIKYINEIFSQYTVFRAPSPIIALKVLSNERVDLILSDWQMPEMSGIELIRRLKEEEQYRNIPVILITGKMNDVNHLKIALDAGAVDYINKPVNKVELTARINSVLKQYEYFNALILAERKNTELVERIYETKIKELVQVGFQVEKRNKALSKIKKTFEESVDMLTYAIESLDKVKNDFNQQFTPQKDWNQFVELLNEIDNGFIERLLKNFPALSLYEQKLCVYIKLGLDSNQIAEIFSINPDSVIKSRFRLRKKMKLHSDDNLQKIILEV